MSEELKLEACGCGGEAVYHNDAGAHWYDCSRCEVGTKFHATQELAAETWNRAHSRAPSAPAPEFVELVEAVREIVDNSHGVDGWHLNGDVARWDEFNLEPKLAAAERALAQKGGERG